MKDRIEKVNATIHQIYQQQQTKAIQSFADMHIASDNIPQFYEIQSGLYKQKSKSVPTIPPSSLPIDEIVIPNEYKVCEDGKRNLLLYQSKDMLVFCSVDGLFVLAKSKRWQSDGTFSCTPLGFEQLYLIHAYYKEQMIVFLVR